jgi:hypothetical protein
MSPANPSPETPTTPREPEPSFALTPETVDSLSEILRELRDAFGEGRPPALRHLARTLAPWPPGPPGDRDAAARN